MTKFLNVGFRVVFLGCLLLFGSHVFAEEMNVVPDGVSLPATSGLTFDPSTDVPFDKSTPVLVYCPAGNTGDVVNAINVLGLTNYSIRYGSSNPVTVDDLRNYSLLVVGWNTGGDMAGLDASIIETCITGRVVITGHDADYHTANTLSSTPGAGFFLAQAMNFVLEGSGTGLVALGDCTEGFTEWLPESWGLNTTYGLALEETTTITDKGIGSGIFDNIDEEDMSNWYNSYHVKFNSWGNGFEAYELGNDDNDVITIGTPVNASGFLLTKDDGIDTSVSPGDQFVYTICFENTTGLTLTNVQLVDELPKELTYPYGGIGIDADMEPYELDPQYNTETHTYTWEIGDEAGVLYPDEYGCVELTVDVNENAEPGMSIYNEAYLTADVCYEVVVIPDDPNVPIDPNVTEIYCQNIIIARASETTPVACWGDTPEIIYVDYSAIGTNTGQSWANAYSGHDGLEKALYRAKNCSCSDSYDFVVYVAAGTYYPGTDEDDSFELLDNMVIYGGFPKGGCDFAYRNPKKYETVLTGQIDEDSERDINQVVTMGNNSLLEGVTVEKAKRYNIYGEGVNFAVKNCQVNKSDNYGIYAIAGDVTIKSCKIYGNASDGISHEGEGFTLNVYNSWIMRSGEYGIFTMDSTLTAKNNIVSESDMKEQGNQGIRLVTPTNSPVLYNNTISNNKSAGIYYKDYGTAEDPNDYPDIQNCIIYFNNGGNSQLAGLNPDEIASYCCIQNCNAVNSNINSTPMFAYAVDTDGTPDPNNYHISYDSICKDAGNPNLDYSNQTDYDSESRIADDEIGVVDIGADEVYSCSGDYSEEDISNILDYNVDGLVNMKEFQLIASSWMSHYENDPAWIADPNLADPILAGNWDASCNLDNAGNSQYEIDIADLEVFLNDYWLWTACWYESSLDLENTTATTESASLIATASVYSSSSVSTLASTTSTMLYIEDTEEEISPYSGLTNSELAELVLGIYDLEDAVQQQLESGSEDSEDLTEILDFFDDILVEIQEYLTESEE